MNLKNIKVKVKNGDFFYNVKLEEQTIHEKRVPWKIQDNFYKTSQEIFDIANAKSIACTVK